MSCPGGGGRVECDVSAVVKGKTLPHLHTWVAKLMKVM